MPLAWYVLVKSDYSFLYTSMFCVNSVSIYIIWFWCIFLDLCSVIFLFLWRDARVLWCCYSQSLVHSTVYCAYEPGMKWLIWKLECKDFLIKRGSHGAVSFLKPLVTSWQVMLLLCHTFTLLCERVQFLSQFLSKYWKYPFSFTQTHIIQKWDYCIFTLTVCNF